MRGHGDDGLLPLKHDRIMPASAAGHLPLTTTLRSTVPKSTTQTSSQSSSSSFHPGQLLRRRHIMTSIIVLLATSAWHHFLTLESDQLDSSLLEGAAALEELQEALTLCRTSETALETTRASLRDSQRSIRRTKNAEALAAIGKERACTARLKDVEGKSRGLSWVAGRRKLQLPIKFGVALKFVFGFARGVLEHTSMFLPHRKQGRLAGF
eukprot:m.90356 g.90356  ORF g.90356 m.90356 type:complete len:210 (-) comp15007_c1_seq1:457-1086(-)